MQSEASSFPTASTYLPAAQSTHAIVEFVEYLPASQGVHTDAPGDARVFVNDPGAQCTQSLLPRVSLKVPASQPMQSDAATLPAFVAYLPTPQLMQSDADRPPEVARYVPATQATQSNGLSLPAASTYLPATQSVQLTLLRAARNLPGWQGRQPLGAVKVHVPQAHWHDNEAVPT